MFRLLLVDDFDIDRENVKDCIDWNRFDIEIVAEAKDGEEAYNIIQQTNIDFVLTDVQMPFMDGIKLAQIIKKTNPHIKVVFMSYYNDFEYLKSAIDVSAYGYILKPFNETEVEEVFSKLLNNHKKEITKAKEHEKLERLLKESKPLLIQNYYKNLLTGKFNDSETIISRAQYLKQPLDKDNYYYRLVMLEIDEEVILNRDIEEMLIYQLNIDELLKNCVECLDIKVCIHIDDSHYALLISADSEQSLFELTNNTISKIDVILQSEIYYNTLCVGVSSFTNNVSDIALLYEQCMDTIKYKFFYGKGQVICYEDIKGSNDAPKIRLDNMQEKIKYLIDIHNKEQIKEYIDELFDGMIIAPDNSYIKTISFSVIMCIQTIINEINSSFEDVYGDKENAIWEKLMRFETIVDLKQWMQNIIFFASEYFMNLRNNKNERLVKSIIEYINEHYKENMTVKSISEQLYYSPNYINKIFKERIGRSIPDYLTHVRIEQAKILLKETPYKIYEIVEAVGYNRISHFNSIFKRNTGLTPREFRNE